MSYIEWKWQKLAITPQDIIKNKTSGHIKVKKGTGHVFYMATSGCATESVCRKDSIHNTVCKMCHKSKAHNKCLNVWEAGHCKA